MAIGPINFKDPRFQEAQLQATAGGPKNRLGLAQQITDRFTANQLNQKLAFQNLATQKRGFESSLSLGKQALMSNDRRFNNLLNYKQRESKIAAGVGLFGAGLGMLEGRRRKKLLQADAATIERRHRELVSAIRGSA
jgi:hypothetical protein